MPDKYPVVAARVDKDTKEFFASYPGLAARVLKDFCKQWKDMEHKKKVSKENKE